MTTRRPALFLLLPAALAAPAALTGCSPSERSWPDNGGLRVVVTFPALDSFARKTAGDHATVRCLYEGPVEDVEDFEPSPEDAALLRRADLLFINGLGLDDEFTQRLRINGNPDLQPVALGKLVPEGDRGGDGEPDPHVWLGVKQAVVMVNGVRDALKKADPPNAADYDANAEAYIKELNGLLDNNKDAKELARKDCKVVTLHDPLPTFMANFGGKVVGAFEVGPDGEPSERDYGRIAELCKAKGVRLIAVPKPYPESLTKKILDRLKDLGAKDVEPPVVIDPLESADDLKSADWYANKMKANLSELNARIK